MAKDTHLMRLSAAIGELGTAWNGRYVILVAKVNVSGFIGE